MLYRPFIQRIRSLIDQSLKSNASTQRKNLSLTALRDFIFFIRIIIDKMAKENRRRGVIDISQRSDRDRGVVSEVMVSIAETCQ